MQAFGITIGRYRIRMNDLGKPDAVPVDKQEYDRMREKTLQDARLAKAAA